MVNARSLRNKTADFLHHALSEDYDVCVISETWLNNDDTSVVEALKPQGFNFQHVCRTKSSRGGGLGIFFKDSIHVRKIKSANHSTFEMCLWNLQFKQTDLILMALYRPPYSANHRKTIPMFISEFSEVWSDILATYSNDRLLLLGDFNIHMDNVNNCDTRSFIELLSNFDCQQHINCQTHESGHIIDLCIAPKSTKLNISPATTDYYLSDHAFINFFVSLPRPPITKVNIQSRPLARINKVAFANDLQSIVEELLCEEGKFLASSYDNKLSELLNKHAPLTSKRVTLKPRVAWFDKEAKVLKLKVRKLCHRWKNTRDDHDLTNYKTARNYYRQHLNDKKRSHFSDAIQSAKTNPRKLFSITMGLMGKRTDNPLPLSDSDDKLANDLANYFIDKINTIRTALEEYPKYQPSGRCSANFPSFQIVTNDTISKLISNSKSATCQLDPIPTKLLKENQHLLTPLITRIVNHSLQQGNFYDDWKTAIVTPLLKKSGLEAIMSNYRPVSNLSFISKIAEKGVIQQLNEYFSKNDLHFNHQSAYKNNFSTETALCVLTNDLLWAMEKTQATVLVALDLSAAFDTVDHSVLHSLLHDNFGISDTALDWMESYLSNRTLKVKVNEAMSSPHTFNYSVPQGSCLGPVLFNVYVSTITECVPEDLSLGGYADDHYIKGTFNPADDNETSSCITRIEDTLNNIHQWMSANRLKMNPSKTEVILFRSQRLLSKNSISSINVAGDTIHTSNCIKYLGAQLDCNLTFDDYIKAKCGKAIINIRNIFHIRKYIDLKTAKQLASSLILSHLDYSNSILAGLPASRLRPLQRVQNWAAKVVLCRSKYDSSLEALQYLHWLPIRERIDFKIACLVYKCLNNLAPEPLSQLISRKTFSRTTRTSVNSNNELHIPFVKKSTHASRSFSIYGPSLWNSLPSHVTSANCFKSFKRQLKTSLFERAFSV